MTDNIEGMLDQIASPAEKREGFDIGKHAAQEAEKVIMRICQTGATPLTRQIAIMEAISPLIDLAGSHTAAMAPTPEAARQNYLNTMDGLIRYIEKAKPVKAEVVFTAAMATFAARGTVR